MDQHFESLGSKFALGGVRVVRRLCCGVGYRADTSPRSLHAETRLARLALELIQTLIRKAVLLGLAQTVVRGYRALY